MGRPPQPVGTYGRIHFVDQPSGEIQARTRFRDYDGRVRMVTKVGRSRASAERALKAEPSNRQAVGGGGAVAAATRMSVLSDTWLEADHVWCDRHPADIPVSDHEAGQAGLWSALHSRGHPRRCQPGAVRHRQEQRAGAAKSARACLSGLVHTL